MSLYNGMVKYTAIILIFMEIIICRDKKREEKEEKREKDGT